MSAFNQSGQQVGVQVNVNPPTPKFKVGERVTVNGGGKPLYTKVLDLKYNGKEYNYLVIVGEYQSWFSEDLIELRSPEKPTIAENKEEKYRKVLTDVKQLADWGLGNSDPINMLAKIMDLVEQTLNS